MKMQVVLKNVQLSLYTDVCTLSVVILSPTFELKGIYQEKNLEVENMKEIQFKYLES